MGRNGETRFRNATFLSCKFRNVAFLNFHRAHGSGVGDPGVTPRDGPCHTALVPHLCVIIIDERVG
jgi:hypothetical protein